MAKKAKAGRPPGAANKEYAAVEEIPAACVRCQSTELKVVKGAPSIYRKIPGTLRSGFRYRAVTHTRKECGECGQRLVVRTYHAAN